MAVNAQALRSEVGASLADEDSTLTSLISTATALVTKYVGQTVSEVPADVMDRAILLTAAEMYHQSQAPNGIVNQQYDDGQAGTPIRIGRDPLTPAYPLLRQWVSGKFFCA